MLQARETADPASGGIEDETKQNPSEYQQQDIDGFPDEYEEQTEKNHNANRDEDALNELLLIEPTSWPEPF